MAALNLFLRLCLYLSYTILLGTHYLLFSISLSLAYTALVAALRPYKAQYAVYNTINTLFMVLFCFFQVAIYGIISFQSERRNWLDVATIAVMVVLAVIPLLYITVLALHWLLMRRPIRNVWQKVAARWRKDSSANELQEESEDQDESNFNAYIIQLDNKA